MFFGTLGSIFAALVATLGPKTGLRTMVITRFSSGHVGGVLYSILNILTSRVDKSLILFTSDQKTGLDGRSQV